jgi:biopolymer transport protein TolR
VGVSVGGRGGASLNLVPFLDLLSVCITFLMATAVWIELDAVAVDQPGVASATSGEPPWQLVVRSGGYEVGRGTLARASDLGRAVAEVHAERGATVVVAAEDGVPWDRVVEALDGLGRGGFSATFDPERPR